MDDGDEQVVAESIFRHVLRVLSPDRGAAVADLVDAVQAKRRDRALNMIERAAKISNLDVATLVARFIESERRLDLLEEAVRQAQGCHLEEKRVALATVLAIGVNDDAQLDFPELLLGMLDHLEAAHVKVLRQISEPRPAPAPMEGAATGGWTNETLRASLPGFENAVDLIVTNLESRGLIRNAMIGTYGGMEGYILWNVTISGETLLELLARDR